MKNKTQVPVFVRKSPTNEYVSDIVRMLSEDESLARRFLLDTQGVTIDGRIALYVDGSRIGVIDRGMMN